MSKSSATRFHNFTSFLQDRHGCGVGQTVVFALAAAAFVVIASFFTSLSGLAGERPADAAGEAAEMLHRARDNREVLSEAFPGFRSKLTVRLDGQTYHGVCSFQLPGNLKVTLPGTDDVSIATDEIRSMLMHRVPSSSTSQQEEVRYGDGPATLLGRKILLGDRYHSHFRVRDDKILEVSRLLGGSRLVVTVLETRATESGRYLPRHVFAVRFDPDSGVVQDATAYVSEFQPVGGEYLPKSRQVIRTGPGHTSVLLVEWSDIELLAPGSES